MRFFDMLRTALLNLWRRKLRAFLTVLGMVIGTTSIVVMVSLGVGIRQATIDSYASIGSLTNITVMSYKWTESPDGMGGTSTEVRLDKKSVEAFKQLPGVVAVMPRIEAWGILKCGKYYADISILGIDSDVADKFGITLSEGEYPQYKGGTTYELVLGSQTLSNFYDPKTWKPAVDRDGNPKVTKDTRIQLTFDYNNMYGEGGYGTDGEAVQKGKLYRINPVGILDESNNDFSWYCLMDLEALKKLAKENSTFISIDTSKYQQVTVKCANAKSVKDVKDAIDAMGYGTNSLQDALDAAEKNMKQIQYLLGAIGGVSLLVAAIGIMNTMMMSIYERTKEIGIIKVLGCRMSNIAGLFLSEASFIGLFGGAAGIGLSYLLSGVLNKFIGDVGFKSIIPPYLAFGAVAFSILVALASGIYPALRAMRLSPLTAIRNE